MNDKIKLTGAVNIDVFENGKLIENISENNLVVTVGKQNMAKLLGGPGSAITQISVGDNGIAADVLDTAITNPFTKAIASVSYPDPQSVMFSFDIDNSEANGMTIREFGLLDAANILFARKRRNADIIKTVAIRLVGTWKITIN